MPPDAILAAAPSPEHALHFAINRLDMSGVDALRDARVAVPIDVVLPHPLAPGSTLDYLAEFAHHVIGPLRA